MRSLYLAVGLLPLLACAEDDRDSDSGGELGSIGGVDSGVLETSGDSAGSCDPDCLQGQVCDDGQCAWPYDCKLTCTSFDPDGSCYCQTACAGAVEIFTCFSDGECVCQGNDHDKTIPGACVSEEAAKEIYHRCHRS